MMKIKMLVISFMVIALPGLTACTTNTQYPNNVEFRPGYPGSIGGLGAANYNVSYGPNANQIDYNHDSSVGYGGVNVYDYHSI